MLASASGVRSRILIPFLASLARRRGMTTAWRGSFCEAEPQMIDAGTKRLLNVYDCRSVGASVRRDER
jgi:hypothetical protein